MPRGAARDTLPEELAAKVRTAVAEARAAKGLTNAGLARRLGWDRRQVTNALSSDQPLRRPNAQALIAAVRKLNPVIPGRRATPDERWEIEVRVSAILAPASAALANDEHEKLPAALIAADDLAHFARWLADGIVRRPGSRRKRDELEKAIARTLDADATGFAFAAYQRLSDIADANRILSRFGYR
jgi:hypothetical protein